MSLFAPYSCGVSKMCPQRRFPLQFQSIRILFVQVPKTVLTPIKDSVAILLAK